MRRGSPDRDFGPRPERMDQMLLLRRRLGVHLHCVRDVRGLVSVVLVCASFAMAAGCSSATPNKMQAYCDEVQNNLAALDAPKIATQQDIDATLELYRSIAAGAPVGVQPEWQELVSSLETAATVNPTDQTSMQRAADKARSTQPAAIRIQQYTSHECGVDIGVVPARTNPVTATTVGAVTTTTG